MCVCVHECVCVCACMSVCVCACMSVCLEEWAHQGYSLKNIVIVYSKQDT